MNVVLLVVLPLAALVLIAAPLVVAARMRRRRRYRYVSGHPEVAAFVAGRAMVQHLNEETGISHWSATDEKPAHEHTPHC